jgi:hypothetical protein
MVTLRSTQKLLRRVGISPKTETVPPTTVLGDWYANILYSRPQQLVVCINERSLLLVLLPARNLKNIGPKLQASVISLLARIGVPSSACASEARAMEEFAFGPTASRRVLGCLNEAMFALCHELEDPRFASAVELEDYCCLRGVINPRTTVIRRPSPAHSRTSTESCCWKNDAI